MVDYSKWDSLNLDTSSSDSEDEKYIAKEIGLERWRERVAVANKFFESGDHERAIDLYRKNIEEIEKSKKKNSSSSTDLNSIYFRTLMNLAVLFHENKDANAGLAYSRKAIEIRINDAKANHIHGQLLQRASKPNFMQFLRKASQLDPEDKDIQESLRSACQSSSSSLKLTIETLHTEAFSAQKSGDFKKAITIWAKVLEIVSGRSRMMEAGVLRYLAFCYARTEKESDLLESYEFYTKSLDAMSNLSGGGGGGVDAAKRCRVVQIERLKVASLVISTTFQNKSFRPSRDMIGSIEKIITKDMFDLFGDNINSLRVTNEASCTLANVYACITSGKSSSSVVNADLFSDRKKDFASEMRSEFAKRCEDLIKKSNQYDKKRDTCQVLAIQASYESMRFLPKDSSFDVRRLDMFQQHLDTAKGSAVRDESMRSEACAFRINALIFAAVPLRNTMVSSDKKKDLLLMERLRADEILKHLDDVLKVYNTHRKQIKISLSLICTVLSCVSSICIRDRVFEEFLGVYPLISSLLRSDDDNISVSMCRISIGLRVSSAQYKIGNTEDALSTMRETISCLEKIDVKNNKDIFSKVCRFKVEALQGIGAMTQDVNALRRGLKILQHDLNDEISSAAVSHSISALLAKKRDWESSCKQYGVTLEILKKINNASSKQALARIYVELAACQSMMGAESLSKDSMKSALTFDGDKLKLGMQFQELLTRYSE